CLAFVRFEGTPFTDAGFVLRDRCSHVNEQPVVAGRALVEDAAITCEVKNEGSRPDFALESFEVCEVPAQAVAHPEDDVANVLSEDPSERLLKLRALLTVLAGFVNADHRHQFVPVVPSVLANPCFLHVGADSVALLARRNPDDA